uniref:Uncharacterized protein AlNc14C52G4049 n=1 Tax=Albugo laibachii Nc14 TaxID=890382 RepID=F0WBK4_9STRA|nr:conserved hypothetical protein [Albugo laibachii Nc14]|eukprot:CCA18531.1 conserved hypothetical protein [Albugo laibachii Nc14]
MTKRARTRGLLHDSQLTDSDRRKIRCKERDILQDIRKNAKELANVTSNKFIETTEELNQVYEQICFPREANLDASNLEELNQAIIKQAQSLGTIRQQYDAADLIRASRESFASDEAFDWEKLGGTVASSFRCVPEINFFFGLMDTKVTEKQRQPTRRIRNDESIQTSQPTKYSAKNDQQDAQARRLETMRLAMKRSDRQDLFRVALHPQSFSQTVENLFDVSFLVRNGALEIGIDDKETPYIEHHPSRTDESMPPQTQSIISITPNQWEELANVMELEEPLEQVRKTVCACGGTFEDDLTPETTHLIAQNVGTTKYQVALEWKLPIIAPAWIFESFRASTVQDLDMYGLGFLEGLTLTTTGLLLEERDEVQRAANQHKAVYDANLEVGKTNLLIAQAPSGIKYKTALQNQIPIVHISWLRDSIQANRMLLMAEYALEKVYQPSQMYSKLHQSVTEFLKGDLVRIMEAKEDDYLMLFDACTFHLIGFTTETRGFLLELIRIGMGTVYYDWDPERVSHLIVSPALEHIDQSMMQQLKSFQRCQTTMTCVSAEWVIESLRHDALQPEENFPCTISEVNDTPATDPSFPAPEFGIVPHPLKAYDNDTKPLFKPESAFLFLCVNPNQLHVQKCIRQLEEISEVQAFAINHQDASNLSFLQFGFLTHIVVCNGASISSTILRELESSATAYHTESQTKGRLRFVSDLWLCCCLSEGQLFPRRSHELFSLESCSTESLESSFRSVLPAPLPLECFKNVSASVSVYVGVDRVVILELLKLVGAKTSRKLSRRNTHLICLNPFGMKYDKAKEWNIPVVNAQWIMQSISQQRLLDITLPAFQVLDDQSTCFPNSNPDDTTTAFSQD